MKSILQVKTVIEKPQSQIYSKNESIPSEFNATSGVFTITSLKPQISATWTKKLLI